jgi:hypothetical protein
VFRKFPVPKALLIAGLVTAISSLGIVAPSLAGAESPPSSAPLSYYVNSSSTTVTYDDGCDQADDDNSSGVDSATILGFYTQISGGTDSDGTDLTNAQVEADAEYFAYGYSHCVTGDTYNILSVGTNNSDSTYQTSAEGKVWADVVNAIRTVVDEDYPNVVVLGGDDIESFSYQSEPDTMNWISGYDANADETYYDFGSADGCPESSDDNGTCSVTGSTDWDQYDYWYVANGDSYGLPIPEIYYSPGDADEWAQISDYGDAYQTGYIQFVAPLSEYARDSGTNTAADAWNDLQTATGQNGFAFNMRLSSGYV